MSDATREPTEKERQLAEHLRVILGRLNRSLRLTQAQKDLPPSQREVLMAIARSGSIRLSDLASEERLNPTMVSRIIAKLEAAGMVTRTPDPRRRSRDSSLGDAGRACHYAKGFAVSEPTRCCYALRNLSKDEKQALSAATPALETIVATLRDRDQ